MANPFHIKVVKVPAWVFGPGIDVKPYVDAALERIGSELERRKGRGLGARNNVLNYERQNQLNHRVMSSRHHPRRSGAALHRNQAGRFRGMAPRVIKKYVVEPLRALWGK